MIQKIALIQNQITKATLKSQRPSSCVTLIAISKKQNAMAIRDAFQAGIRHFGENYCQEALQKIADLQDLAITWHFTGPIQSNKTAAIARHFSWVHGVDREKIIRLLSQHRPQELPPLNVCIQINLDDEDNKAGVRLSEARLLANSINDYPNLILRGFMAIPKPYDTIDKQYASFLRLSDYLEHHRQQLPDSIDTLSMGMSNDFEAAILAGSTMVRIGQAIFGARL